MTDEELSQVREQLAQEVESLIFEMGANTSVFAQLWIRRCANRVRGIA